MLEPAAAHLGRPVLNAEQMAAWRAAFEQAVSVVWGPPGTGKTYLLAWTLIGLAAAARRANRPMRILVSAATHRAIVNVLARIARELEAAGIESPLRAVKLAGRGSEADADLEGLSAEVIQDDELPRVLDESAQTGQPVVVGSTVWSLWKQMRAIDKAARDDGSDGIPVRPLFDVVVIDEASQMKVPDALIALSSIRRGGRVILAGDDRQLPPILHGRYPRDETLFGSAFTHFADRFGRFQLRESRRMNRALVRWPRRLFYPGFVSKDAERRLMVSADAVDIVRSAGRAAVGRVPAPGRRRRAGDVRGRAGHGAQRVRGAARGAHRPAGEGGDDRSGDGRALYAGGAAGARAGRHQPPPRAEQRHPGRADGRAAGRATSCPWWIRWSGCRATSAS